MTPNVNLRSYYLNFIANAKQDIINYKKIIKDNDLIINDLIEIFDNKKVEIYNDFKIKIEDYYDLSKKSEEERLAFEKEIAHYINVTNDFIDRNMMFKLLKFSSVVASNIKHSELIKSSINRKAITYSKFRDYVSKYYTKVHKVLLEGEGYRYGGNLGVFIINYWKTFIGKNYKPVLDFKATAEKKKRLLAEGVELYNKVDAIWHKNNNLPYNGVDYKVYKQMSYYYEFTFIPYDSKSLTNLEFRRIEYVKANLRGKGYAKLAEEHKGGIDTIHMYPVDIKYKLNMMLHIDPTKYLNFIRNATRERIEYRKNYCQS